jgi:hypothetical protein
MRFWAATGVQSWFNKCLFCMSGLDMLLAQLHRSSSPVLLTVLPGHHLQAVLGRRGSAAAAPRQPAAAEP